MDWRPRLRSLLGGRRIPERWLRALGALCVFLALGGWALASPVGASPDENNHLASIWCSHGEQAGRCEPGTSDSSRRVPSTFPLDSVCYREMPDQSAACQPEWTPGELAETTRGNFDGMYPPVFYWVAGLFVSDDIGASVLTMRLVNALLYVALAIAVYLLVPAGLRRAIVVGALVTSVPVALFLVPSINPSSWAILSATTLLVSLVGFLRANDRRRRVALGALAGLAMLLGAGARADAAVYAVIACVVALVLVWHRDAGLLRRAALPAALVVVAGALFLSTGQSSAVDAGAAPSLSLGRLTRALIDVPAVWTGGLGSPPPRYGFGYGFPWGLGWLDTGMPGVVWAGMWGVYIGVLFLALAGASRRRLLATAVVGAAALLIPAYMEWATVLAGGVQPRYVLPLLTLLAVVATIRLDGEAFLLTNGQRWALVAVLSVANAVALHTLLRRYVTGNDVVSWNLDRGVEWWWSIPVSPLAVWVLASIAFATGVFLLTAELMTRAAATDGASRG